jgi:hypothetical protein
VLTASRFKQSADGGRGRFFIGRFLWCLTHDSLLGLSFRKFVRSLTMKNEQQETGKPVSAAVHFATLAKSRRSSFFFRTPERQRENGATSQQIVTMHDRPQNPSTKRPSRLRFLLQIDFHHGPLCFVDLEAQARFLVD